MRILLTNDDGIHAPGIVALFDAIAGPIGEFPGPLRVGPGTNATDGVFVVAPLTVQSATGHGVTFKQPLMTTSVKVTERMSGVAVDGRPADCVKLAVANLWPEKFGARSRPDLLISGMNAGANCGINVIYSGTVAAAIEGAFLGVPSIAVSLMLGQGQARFDVAARHARAILEALLAKGSPDKHECLSINLPVTESDGPVPELRVCPMNTHGLVDKYERRVSPIGDVYYWAAGHGLDFHATQEGSDVGLLKNGFATLTPLQYDLTMHGSLAGWAKK